MEERKFVKMKKEEFGVKEFIKKEFGKGKVSTVKIEYTPVGEKVVVFTHKPGLIIGKRGESIERLTETLKKRFKMENPHVDIAEITRPDLDAHLVADDIALSIERFGSLRFKAIAYKALTRIKAAKALGAEIVLSGRLPSERAKTWRFKFGYLKKTGDAVKDVDYAESTGKDSKGVVGVKVSILPPEIILTEEVIVNEELMKKLKANFDAYKEDKAIKMEKKVKPVKTVSPRVEK